MKTITVASCKGGSGKSTTVVTLATRAAVEFGRVAMIDMNEDQGTLTQWWNLRGRSVNPYLLKDPGDIEADLKMLASQKYDVCFIDTPPMDMELIEISIVLADAVVIPIMCSYFDTAAIDAVIDMCNRRKKPYAFLLSAFDNRKPFEPVVREVMASLKGRGNVFEAHLSYNAKYRLAQIDGLTGFEKDSKLRLEVDALWQEIKALARFGKPSLDLVQGGKGV